MSTFVRKKRSAADIKEALAGYAFIAPVVIGLFVFYSLPALSSLYFAFTKWDGLTAPEFIGLENFRLLFQDEKFLKAMLNTVFYSVLTVPVSIIFATLLAVLLNRKISGRVVYRTLYFIPVITMPIAVGMVWRWLYNSEFGLINYVLGLVHLPQPNWLFDEKLSLISIVLVSVWSSVGYNAIILLSGLQGISTSYYEAADLDGANGVQKFFNITLPLLSPTMFFVLVISLINALQVFDLIFIMMNKADALLDSTRTVVYNIWENGFKYFNMGYASAEAWLLFILILAITAIQLYFQKKWVHYQ